MEFNSVYRTPSASSSSFYTNFSDQAPEAALWSRAIVRSESFRELEKQIIREEILAEEVQRRRVLEVEVRRELEMVAMQSRQEYASALFMLRQPLIQQCPQPPEMITTSLPKVEKGMIGLGNPTPSGVKRKRSPGSSDEVNKWRCVVCKVRMTSERQLQEHVAGKKHRRYKIKKRKRHLKKHGNKSGRKSRAKAGAR